MPDDYDYEMEIFLDPDATSKEEGFRMRLQNLGYNTGEPLQYQVEAFQRERGLAVTGIADDAANHVTQCHEDCQPPLRTTEDDRR